MLNKEKHQLIMGRILKDIYSNTSIAAFLGFKGGTCAYFFYDLQRFSVDLDFDLLIFEKGAEERIFDRIEKILKEYGVIRDRQIKRNTIFFLLSYGDEDHNIKIEINIRKLMGNIREHYELKEYLGIPMFVAKKGYLFASKLAALKDRSQMAMRDVYDIYYFAKNNWDIDRDVLKIRTGKGLKAYLHDCIEEIEKIKENRILQGLGELFNEKEKIWLKKHLKSETVFMLRNYMEASQ